MKLSLKNIGKVKEADIEIKRITVIAGENNTGKSTVSRALFAMFHGFYDHYLQDNAEQMLTRAVTSQLGPVIDSSVLNPFLSGNETLKAAIQQLLKTRETLKSNPEALKADIREQVIAVAKETNKSAVEEAIAQLQKVLTIPDIQLFCFVLTWQLRAEFNGQVTNIFTEEPGVIDLTIREKVIHVTIEQNEVNEIAGMFELVKDGVYLDDPFMMDNLQTPYRVDSHRHHLRQKLQKEKRLQDVIPEFLAEEQFKEIYEQISEKVASACPGEVLFDQKNGNVSYRMPGFDKTLVAANLSMGLKTFAILKRLLGNGTIQQNGVLILDEPENHLHPAWQILFAEVIVLIQKVFGVHILLNTHSPYFLNAIDVYARKHSIAEDCRYYLAKNEGQTSTFEDVSDDLEAIYKKLAKPFQTLDDEDWNNA